MCLLIRDFNVSDIGKCGGGGGEGACQKPQNGKSKFINLLILEYLKNYFIEPPK